MQRNPRHLLAGSFAIAVVLFGASALLLAPQASNATPMALARCAAGISGAIGHDRVTGPDAHLSGTLQFAAQTNGKQSRKKEKKQGNAGSDTNAGAGNTKSGEPPNCTQKCERKGRKCFKSCGRSSDCKKLCKAKAQSCKASCR